MSTAAAYAGLGKLNHVAIAVPDLESSMSLYKDVLGAEVSEPKPQEAHGVTAVFVEMPGNGSKVELIHPLHDKSPISKFLEQNPAGGIHHICFEVEDLQAAIDHVSSTHIRILGEPKIGAHNVPVIFMHPKDTNGVLIELQEGPGTDH